MSSRLEIYKGSDAHIRNTLTDIVDGRLMFAVDTKQIYLDYDVPDGALSGPERIKFGGSTGIFYAEEKEFKEGEQPIFSLYDLSGELHDYPHINDLILNEKDGSFYRVTEININSDEIYAKRLTISGTGSGGGTGGGGSSSSGYVERKLLGPTSTHRYFSVKSTEFNLPFLVRSSAGEDVRISAAHIYQVIDKGQSTEKEIYLRDIENIRASWDENDPVLLNFRPVMEQINFINTADYYFAVIFEDEFENVSRKVNFSITAFDISLTPVDTELTTVVGSTLNYWFTPNYYKKLQDITAKIDIVHIATQTHFPQPAITINDSGTAYKATLDVSGLANGAYMIQTTLEALIPDSNNSYVTSDVLTQIFIKQSTTKSDPIIACIFPSPIVNNESAYDQYESIAIDFKVSYSEDKIPIVREVAFTAPGASEPVITTGEYNIDTEKTITWNYQFLKKGTYKFTIYAGETGFVKTSSETYTISKESDNVPSLTKNNLIVNFSPVDKENSSVDRDEWISSVNGEVAKGTLTGFNWTSNGWLKEEYKDENGNLVAEVPYLYLTNGAKLEIDYSPFARAVENQISYGAERYGKAIEFDVSIDNIRERSQELIKCLSRTPITETNEHGETIVTGYTLHSGIVVNGDYFMINNSAQKPLEEYYNKGFVDLAMSGMTATYNNGERVHVTFIITPKKKENDEATNAAGLPLNMMCTYINGVMSGLVAYSDTTTFMDAASTDITEDSNKFIFDSTHADIKIYNLRVYDTVLTDQAVLTNYLATLPTIQEMTDKFIDNSILDEDGNISLNLVRARGNIPYIIFRGGRKVTSKKGDTFAHESPASASNETGAKWLSLPEAKDDYRLVDMCFIDPQNPSKNIGSWVDDSGLSSNRIKTVIYAQGTSSMGYPIKNLRMKFAKSEKYKYSLEPEEKNAAGVIVSKGLPEVDLFCLKADYMESSSSHNTGFCNLLNNIYGNLKTPAQMYQPDKQIVTAIKGRPIIIFYRETDEDIDALQNLPDVDSEYRYIGRYNFNLDKSTHEPFGFFNDYENHYGVALINPPDAQEIASKGYAAAIKEKTPISGYHATIDEQPDKNKTYYKDPEGKEAWDYNDLWELDDEGEIVWKIKSPAYELRTAPASLDGLTETEIANAGMNSIQCWECLDNGLVHVNFQQPWVDGIDSVDAWTENFESRYPEYPEEEMSDKRALSRVLNWVASTNARNATGEERERLLKKFKDEFELYFDKNLTLIYYLLTEFFIMMDSRAKNMMLCTFTANCKDSNGNDVAKWFPIFYDADTQCCVDNTGALRFRYKDEDTFKNVFNAEASYEYPKGSEDAGQGNSGRYSVLWTNINLTMYEDLKKLYRQLRGGAFNYATLINSYNTNQSKAWNETYTNKDAYVKYINPYLVDPAGGVLLYAEQGTRELHREKFFRQRFSYMDSKYAYIYGGATLDWRINNLDGADQYVFKSEGPYIIEEYVLTADGKEELKKYDIVYENGQYSYTDHMGIVHTSDTLFENAVPADSARLENKIFRFNNLKVQDAMYPCFHVGNRGSDPMNTTRFDRLDEGEELDTLLVSSNVATQAEQPFYIDMADNWISLGDLSNKGISRFTKTSNGQLKLNNVIVSTNEPGYEDILNGIIPSQLEIPAALPMLQELNVAYWPKLGALNLKNNVNLKKLYAYGSALTSCTLPVGGILEEIQLPATLKEISIIGHNNLTSFGYAQYNANKNELVEGATAWRNLTRLYVEQCAKLDTKTIVENMLDGAQIKLPDINWTISKTDFHVNSDNVIDSIPILEKIVGMGGFDGELAIENGQKTLGRSYVKGTITIKNDVHIVDEGMLYDSYLKYYPYITVVVDNPKYIIEAYGFNVYNANGTLMPFNTMKFKENQLNQFTMENCFGVKDNLKLLPIDREQSDEYIYIFKGWNNKEVEFYSERDFASFEEMDLKASENLVVEYVDGEYQVRNGFDFANYFTKDRSDLNIYPTFLAKVREFEIRFWDGQEILDSPNGSLMQLTMVKYGDVAIPPTTNPSLTRLDEDDLSKVDVYQFSHYNNKNGVKETSFIVIDSADYVAQYNMSKSTPIQEYPADESYFIIGTAGTLSFNLDRPYTAKAICIPKTVNSISVQTIQDLKKNHNIERYFFENDNSIQVIGRDALSVISGQENLDKITYVDFASLKNLTTISANAFSGREHLTGSNLSDTVTRIDQFAFNMNKNLKFTALPKSLNYLGQGAFSWCIGLETIIFDCPNLAFVSDQAFSYCSKVKFSNDMIPTSIVEIGEESFLDCQSLVLPLNNSMNFNLETIKASAFGGTGSLNLSAIPNGVKVIENAAFKGASTVPVSQQLLNFTTFPSSITKIGSQAFARRTMAPSTNGLLDLSKCVNLTELAADAFAGLEGIKQLKLPPQIPDTSTYGANIKS